MTDLERTYIQTHAAIMLKLTKLTELIEDYPADSPSWPLVGNLNYIEGEIDNLLRFELHLEDDEMVLF